MNQLRRVVLTRLKDDLRIPETITKIARTLSDRKMLLSACFDAEHLKRTFSKRVAEERRMPERQRTLIKQVRELRQFVDEIVHPADPLESWFILPDGMKTAEQDALGEIEEWIERRSETAVTNLRRLGATRKSAPKNKTAGENVAIGLIADAVHVIAGKPLTQHAKVLAEAALGLDELSEERVREARRSRQQKNSLLRRPGNSAA